MSAQSSLRVLTAFLCLAAVQAQPRAAPPPEKITDPKRLLQLAIEALGSEAKVQGLKTLRLEWVGHTLMPEQSERPEGPYVTNYQQAVEEVDLDNLMIRQVITSRSLLQPKGVELTYVLTSTAGVIQLPEGQAPAPPSVVLDNIELFQQLPHRALAAAMKSPDLRLVEEAKFQGVPHRVVAYKPGKSEVRIWLNSSTNLPTAVDWTTARPGDLNWSVLGDIKVRLLFGSWSLEAGILFPKQWNIERNGKPWSQRSYTVVTVNPALDKRLFELDPTPRRASVGYLAQTVDDVPLGRQNEPALPIQPTLIFLPGPYNVAMVRQEDGVVVLEAPISAGYSRKVMEDIVWRFREAPVKAVITTSDSWPQVAGIREYIAAGIPVYALDLNQSTLETFSSAPRTLVPDRLSRLPKQPNWNWLSGKTVVGSKLNPIEVYPIRGEASERTLMAYFPDSKLLWTGDLINRNQDGSFFMPAYLGELVNAVRRERLDVAVIFGIHLRPTAYNEIAAAWYRSIGVPVPEATPSHKPSGARPAAPKTAVSIETLPGMPSPVPASPLTVVPKNPPASKSAQPKSSAKSSTQAKPGNQ